jgi:catechol 2,3-dioxygenase-like lactoylglutathione lyase family enzyme
LKIRGQSGGGSYDIDWRHGCTGAARKPAPALKLNFLSHGTLESRDLAFSRRFYEGFLGLEVVQTSPVSLLIRLGGRNTIAVVYSKNVGGMNLLNHNGLDVRTREEVDEAHRVVCAQAGQWHLKNITKPHLQHGTYSFFFWDGDDNCWEILTNPEGGYSWLFEQGDQQGKGHLDRNFKRPGVVT